ncbi:blue copper protein precursor [Iris pallida]|uniref:Blue copper protein n=1 Tax=Iris pallida TaxID=29817 RepID=A0AAX6EJZ5_IRIPA|nr:blue copper protein precursor [Iris pallida]
MSSMARVTALLLVFLAATPAAFATDYTVGESSGWTSGTDYNTWLSGKTFNVGDSLLFSYSMLHSVYEVSKSDYDSCSSTNSLQSYTDGSSTIKLTAPGTRYFICGTFGHCTGGMKLAVNVGSGAGGTNSPAATPGTSGTSTPSSTTTNPSTKATDSSNAAAGRNGFRAAGGVVAGVSALVGLAIMG